ncbi:MAG: alginate lyase family protein [Alphaproteobacteria bacterium]|nr:alginate lyase family protein [Alphaproteobacteria bacterium]
MSFSTRLRWYKNRLAAMSAAEVAHRVCEALRKKADAAGARQFIATPRDYGALPQIPGLREAVDAWRVPEPLLAQWAEDARQAQTGEHVIFGQKITGPRDLMWHRDPLSGTLWPRSLFCFAVDYRHARDRGDIKFVWELNRLQYLQPVAALARKRNDKELAAFCLDEIENWIDSNPPFLGVNWNSGIELALRAISILTVVTFVGEHATRTARAKIWATLQTHARWIARYPSLYSSANNHRTAEGLGLFAIGALCPYFAESGEWKQKGWAILCDAAQKQILADGAGAEQATGYAASLLETLLAGLKIAQGCGVDVPDYYVRKLTLGGEYLRWLTDAGGHQPAIGDDDNACVFGVYHSNDAYAASVLGCIAALTNRADLTPPGWRPHLRQALFGAPPAPDFMPYGVRSFPQGGMTVGRHASARGDILLAFDHGPVGYLSIAAHGHADTLAVWLHVGDQPVFVDAGTYIYHSPDNARAYFRGTAAHNTLTLEGADSSTMSGNFNWSRKATPALHHFSNEGDAWYATASHDGYEEKYGAVHRRALAVAPATGAVIEDTVLATAARRVDIAFLLHPDLTARQEGADLMIMKGEQLVVRLRHESPLAAKIGLPGTPEGGWYAQEFDTRQPATRIAFTGTLPPNQKAVTRIYWVA